MLVLFLVSNLLKEFLQLVRDIPRASVDTIEQIAGAAASSEMPAGKKVPTNKS